MTSRNGSRRERIRDRVLPSQSAFRRLVGTMVLLPTTAVLLARMHRGVLTQADWLLLSAIVFTSLIGVFGAGAFSTAMDAVRGDN